MSIIGYKNEESNLPRPSSYNLKGTKAEVERTFVFPICAFFFLENEESRSFLLLMDKLLFLTSVLTFFKIELEFQPAFG
jgi:hypothetical protein